MVHRVCSIVVMTRMHSLLKEGKRNWQLFMAIPIKRKTEASKIYHFTLTVDAVKIKIDFPLYRFAAQTHSIKYHAQIFFKPVMFRVASLQLYSFYAFQH